MNTSMHAQNVWAIVLAGGDGERLRALTTLASGETVPKQYCSLDGRDTLAALALRRARRIAAPSRVLAVVSEAHRQWWNNATGAIPAPDHVVQPRNRGTAAGLLLPLLEVHRRDPLAVVAVIPSDHWVREEAVLSHAVSRAIRTVSCGESRIVLLGIEADAAETGYGWIVAGRSVTRDVSVVARFVEKPPRMIAEELFRDGALWNSFLFVARAASLIDLYRARLPTLLDALESVPSGDAERLRRVYADLPALDASRDLFEGTEDRLAVLSVPLCGWSDLGTVDRVASLAASPDAPTVRTYVSAEWAAVPRYRGGAPCLLERVRSMNAVRVGAGAAR